MARSVGKQVAQQNRKAVGWQAECEEINRSKAQRIRRASWRKRVVVVLGVTGGAYAAIMAGWLWHSGQLNTMQQQSEGWLSQKLAQTGLVVKGVTVLGQQKLTPQEIVDAAAIKHGDAMFALSLSEIKQRLEKHPQISSAQLERVYPDQLSITVIERIPAAVWQHNGEKNWVDAQGVVLQSDWTEAEISQRLPVITGEKANEHLPDLLQIISAAPELESQVLAAQWIGSRRWSLVMKKDVKVLLPAEGAKQAWQKLAQMQRQYSLLDRAVTQIDLRIEGRVFVRYEEQYNPSGVIAVTASL